MKSYERCPRLYNELRTPGNIHTPDGPSYVAKFQCARPAKHTAAHLYLPWIYKRERV